MKYLNLTIIFQGSNLNYGESFGNVLNLKKFSMNGKNYSYISRQALRYDIVRILNETYGWGETPVNKEKGVIQFKSDAKIDKFPEIDLFGYMKTEKKGEDGNGKTKIRKAVVRLTDAVSLEPFNNDMEFATNMGLAARAGLENDIYNSEIHKSYYTYTITAELDKIGVDENYKINLTAKKKSERVIDFLQTVKLLFRDIRGKRENLSPVFVIGGLYDIGNPFFYNRLQLKFTKDGILLNTDAINEILETSFKNETISSKTQIGYLKQLISNIAEIQVKQKSSVNNFFDIITDEVKKYYK